MTSNGGRNSFGRITVRHRGGGHKKSYRIIDFKRHSSSNPPFIYYILRWKDSLPGSKEKNYTGIYNLKELSIFQQKQLHYLAWWRIFWLSRRFYRISSTALYDSVSIKKYKWNFQFDTGSQSKQNKPKSSKSRDIFEVRANWNTMKYNLDCSNIRMDSVSNYPI